MKRKNKNEIVQLLTGKEERGIVVNLNFFFSFSLMNIPIDGWCAESG